MENPSKPVAKRNHTVGAVQSALRILTLLGEAGKPLRLTSIARALDLHGSTCLNILRTLVDESWVRHDPDAKTYMLDRGPVELARQSLVSTAHGEMVRARLDEFARIHDVSVLLWRRMERDLMVAAYANASPALHIRADIGTRLPLLAGSAGRVVAASGELDEAKLRQRFLEVEWHGEDQFSTFLEEVREARTRGWTVDRGSMDNSWFGIAVAVPGSGELRYILNIPLFAGQFTDERVQRLGTELIRLGVSLRDAGLD